MNKKRTLATTGALALALSTLVTGCWNDNSAGAPQSEPVALAPAPEAPALAPVADAHAPTGAATPVKVDPVSASDLKAGVEAITPRIVATTDGFQKVAPRQDARFALHPDSNKNPSIEFDAKGLSSLKLSPYIADFSTVADCAGSPEAGVVRMRWSLDGGTPNEVAVDRNYSATIDVDVSKASRLKIEVDQANGVNWCDWFGLGISNVK